MTLRVVFGAGRSVPPRDSLQPGAVGSRRPAAAVEAERRRARRERCRRGRAVRSRSASRGGQTREALPTRRPFANVGPGPAQGRRRSGVRPSPPAPLPPRARPLRSPHPAGPAPPLLPLPAALRSIPPGGTAGPPPSRRPAFSSPRGPQPRLSPALPAHLRPGAGSPPPRPARSAAPWPPLPPPSQRPPEVSGGGGGSASGPREPLEQSAPARRRHLGQGLRPRRKEQSRASGRSKKGHGPGAAKGSRSAHASPAAPP